MDPDYSILYRHRSYLKPVAIGGAVVLVVYFVLVSFVSVDSYAPEHVYEHYDYGFGEWIWKGKFADDVNKKPIREIVIYAFPNGKEVWPVPDELDKLPVVFQSQNVQEIAAILRMIQEPDPEAHERGERIGWYGVLFTAIDQSRVYFPFSEHTYGISFSFVSEGSSLVFGGSCIGLWEYLKERGSLYHSAS